jgi:recombination protein RecR
MYPNYFLKLIEVLRKFPSVGMRTAERYAFSLVNKPKEEVREMVTVLEQFIKELYLCDECGCLSESGECHFCPPRRMNTDKICVVATPKDVFSIENTHMYRGFYHVTGALLSPLSGKGPEDLRFLELKERIKKYQIKEVIVALDSTIEGDATALHLKDEFDQEDLIVTRLAFGLPMGSSLEYVDGGTLTQALQARASL